MLSPHEFATLMLVKDAWPMGGSLAFIIPQVAVLSALGAAIYAVLVLALWRLSGRPTGAERRVLDVLGGMLSNGLRRF